MSHHPVPCRSALATVLAVLAVAACSPKIEIAPPKEPITINLNIKLDADVRLRVEEEAEDDVESKDIF